MKFVVTKRNYDFFFGTYGVGTNHFRSYDFVIPFVIVGENSELRFITTYVITKSRNYDHDGLAISKLIQLGVIWR